jgi:opacity protein-like surface antigen
MRFMIGGRSLHDSDWDPIDDQVAFGFEFVREPLDAPLGYELGTQVGTSTESVHVTGTGNSADVTSLVSEIYGGLHKTFLRDAAVQPFVGGGLTLVYASLDSHFHSFDTSDDDTTVGLYVHGGFETRIANNLVLGIDLRGVFGTDINLFGNSGDADYGQAAVFLGVGF